MLALSRDEDKVYLRNTDRPEIIASCSHKEYIQWLDETRNDEGMPAQHAPGIYYVPPFPGTDPGMIRCTLMEYKELRRLLRYPMASLWELGTYPNEWTHYKREWVQGKN